jgi:hypothetical protein
VPNVVEAGIRGRLDLFISFQMRLTSALSGVARSSRARGGQVVICCAKVLA